MILIIEKYPLCGKNMGVYHRVRNITLNHNVSGYWKTQSTPFGQIFNMAHIYKWNPNNLIISACYRKLKYLNSSYLQTEEEEEESNKWWI